MDKKDRLSKSLTLSHEYRKIDGSDQKIELREEKDKYQKQTSTAKVRPINWTRTLITR